MTVKLTGRVAQVFARCQREQRAALIPFLVAGDPNPAASLEVIAAVGESGADIIEIGIPYSDPLADGPTIQRAAQRALAQGMRFAGALELARLAKQRLPSIPLIAFTYYNPVFKRGIEQTARDFADAGFAGIIVPDLPPVEASPLLDAFRAHELSVTLLVAPTTQPERAAAIAAQCTDFVYVVSRMGVTGADRNVSEMAFRQVQRLRALTDKPLAVGFGVASAASAAAIASFADGVIVGSALIDRIAAARTPEDAVQSARRFCFELSRCCRREPRNH
ncbi:MAG: tryptophan synthase subunit alpha [Candidatus Eremiobacteraeota bacterium]|nr:tryptophan synthase subunit alpha [Candidatus Eremiobacteraeota bacterium]